MAYELVEEILDHAPRNLTPTEVLLMTVIAEQARAASRTATISSRLLAHRTRLTPIGLRRCFQRLEKHGIHIRIPIRILPSGQPLYAVPGTICSFILPEMPPPPGCPCHRCHKQNTKSTISRSEEVPQDLHQTKEVPQGSQAVPQDRLAVPQYRQTIPQYPLYQSGETFGLSPGRTVPSADSINIKAAEPMDPPNSRSSETRRLIDDLRRSLPRNRHPKPHHQ